MRGRITATVIGAAILIGGYAAFTALDGTATAGNVWLESAGAASCTRSATPISYSAAVSGGNVCADLEDACAVTLGGDTIVAKTGYYRSSSGGDTLSSDCSDGSGTAYDPNWVEHGVSEGSTANWVTLRGESGCTVRSIVFAGSSTTAAAFTFHGNNHIIVNGGSDSCFYFRAPQIGATSDSTLTTQNIQILNSDLDGARISGAKNILISNYNGGPSLACAGSGDGASVAATCKANGNYFEEPWRPVSGGRAGIEGFPFKISQNTGNAPTVQYASINIRLEHGYHHDHQSRDADAPGTEWHDEGILLQYNNGWTAGSATTCCSNPVTGDNPRAANNIVLDDLTFERNAIMEFFVEETAGWTLQNSTMGCPTEDIQFVEDWGDCVPTQYSLDIKNVAGTTSPQNVGTYDNILVRYNAISNGVAIEDPNTSNMRWIGNIIGGKDVNATQCSNSGTWARNAFVGFVGCGSNQVALGATSPWLDTTYGTSWTNTKETDYHLTGTAAANTLVTDAITETSSDYALTTDMDGDARASGSRTIGPDER